MGQAFGLNFFKRVKKSKSSFFYIPVEIQNKEERMNNKDEKFRYGLTFFRSGTPPWVKVRGVLFFILFCVIIAANACYWLFANSVEPILLGMPFGMFFIVFLIGIEFVVLITLYSLEGKDNENKGGQ